MSAICIVLIVIAIICTLVGIIAPPILWFREYEEAAMVRKAGEKNEQK